VRTLFPFHGGIVPAQNKRQSVRTPVASAGIPPELVLPLSQHIGDPATPVVRVGERVLKGQMIAAANGAISAALHAPTSGTVRAIEDRRIAHPSGRRAPCLVIAADGRDDWIAHGGTPHYRDIDGADLIGIIRDAGIAGLGGAGFPTASKLSVSPAARITTLVINGAECEPYITCDDMLMRLRAAEVIEGANILRHILSPRETLIGVEDNKPEALAALRAAAQGSDIEIVAFPARYPSGGEKQLIEILTGRQVPSGALPAEAGVLCLNVASTAAIFDAVTRGQPLVSRITTVTGAAVREPQNFEVLIGTPMRYLLEKAGCDTRANCRLIVGGPMMGFTAPDIDAPIVKTTNCLLAPTEAELPAPPPAQACIRCGWCAQACPASLLPQQLFWFAQGREFDKLAQHNLFDCIECGACSYVCPSSIPLVQYYRASKADILQWRRDRATAEASRQRFEARQQRLQRDEREREAKRAARKEEVQQRSRSSAGNPTEDDPIRAAVERARARKAALQGATHKNSALVGLEQAVASAQRRLETATARLAQATAEGSDIVEALQAGVARTRARLDAAEQALHNFRQSQPATTSTGATPDPARSAIDQAGTADTAGAIGQRRESAHAELERLQRRLQHSRESLARCRDNGEQPKVIFALEATVARLTEQVDAARQQLQAIRDD